MTKKKDASKKDEKPKLTKKELDEIAVDLSAKTLTGDIRDFLLDRERNFKKPWAAMSEDEQSEQIFAATKAAESLVRNVAKIVAAGGRKSISGSLTSLTQKDKIKATIEFNKQDELRHELYDAQGSLVVLVISDLEELIGEREPAKAQPDQHSLLDKAGEDEEDD